MNIDCLLHLDHMKSYLYYSLSLSLSDRPFLPLPILLLTTRYIPVTSTAQ